MMMEIPLEQFKTLLKRMNVYKHLHDDCLQELCLAWLAGKRTEKEMKKTIIDFCYRQRRGIPMSHKLHLVRTYDKYDYEWQEEEQTIIRFISLCYRRGIITKLQAQYIYLWALGDSDSMIAEFFGVERSSVARNRKAGIKKIRKAVG